MIIQKWMRAKYAGERAVYFRKEFLTKDFKNAVLEITALGWFKAFINGRLRKENY